MMLEQLTQASLGKETFVLISLFDVIIFIFVLLTWPVPVFKSCLQL